MFSSALNLLLDDLVGLIHQLDIEKIEGFQEKLISFMMCKGSAGVGLV